MPIHTISPELAQSIYKIKIELVARCIKLNKSFNFVTRMLVRIFAEKLHITRTSVYNIWNRRCFAEATKCLWDIEDSIRATMELIHEPMRGDMPPVAHIFKKQAAADARLILQLTLAHHQQQQQTAAGPVKQQQTAASPVKLQQTAAGPVKQQQTSSSPIKLPQTAAGPVKLQPTAAGTLAQHQAQAGPIKLQPTAANKVKLPQTAAGTLAQHQAHAGPVKVVTFSIPEKDEIDINDREGWIFSYITTPTSPLPDEHEELAEPDDVFEGEPSHTKPSDNFLKLSADVIRSMDTMSTDEFPADQHFCTTNQPKTASTDESPAEMPTDNKHVYFCTMSQPKTLDPNAPLLISYVFN
jgi:hypothetical protein